MTKCTIDMPWGACGEPAEHALKAPPGHEDLPMCADHYSQATALEETLRADPELTERFKQAVNEAHKDGLN